MSNKEKVIIVGAGGHGGVVLDILQESGREVLGFIDNDLDKIGKMVFGIKVLGDWSYVRNFKASEICIALGIGNNAIREENYTKARSLGLRIISAIHPHAIVSKQAKLSEGVTIMPGAIINVDAVLEEGVVGG